MRNDRGFSTSIRLVRSAQTQISPRYTVSADGQEVTDNQTSLIWRRCAEGTVFSGGICAGTPIQLGQVESLQRAASQANATGVAWRLPNPNDLFSIVDQTRHGPAIDPAAFPNTPQDGFWSASPSVVSGGSASDGWSVDFFAGGVGYGYRTYGAYLRLVRAGL